MNKKALILLTVFLLILSLTACSDKDVSQRPVASNKKKVILCLKTDSISPHKSKKAIRSYTLRPTDSNHESIRIGQSEVVGERAAYLKYFEHGEFARELKSPENFLFTVEDIK